MTSGEQVQDALCMTRRDRLAWKILMAVLRLSNSGGTPIDQAERLSCFAYSLADKMLAQEQKQP